MRAIGIDVHRDFCEVAVSEAGQLRSAGRVASRPEELELFAASLAPDDEVVLEATGNALAIARILEPRASRVVVASARELHAITDAKAKTDRRDARTLARLLAADMFEGTWLPGEEVRALRRRLAHRAQLVRARTRLKNEVHAALCRNLVGAPPATDLFGVAGLTWLAELALPADEHETLASCLRTIAFLDGEVAGFERAIARYALRSSEIRRLLTIPGVGLLSAATFVAVVDSGASESAASLPTQCRRMKVKCSEETAQCASRRSTPVSRPSPQERCHHTHRSLAGCAARSPQDASSNASTNWLL